MFGRILRKAGRANDLARFLYKRKVHGLQPPGDTPWFDPEGIELFKTELAKATSYLEFGSGGSTVLVDRAGIPAVSVESDPVYAEAVKSRLKGGRVKMLSPDIGLTGEWGTPLFRNHAKWRRYIEAPFPIEPFPDFILVDGRFRVACALQAAKYAHEAGALATLMFDDYAPRPHYHLVESHLGQPRIVGRAALFNIGSTPISQAAIDYNARDYR
jgi:hypothetical protein